MKVGTGNNFQGSFGIPQQLKDEMEDFKRRATAERAHKEEEEASEEEQHFEEIPDRMPQAEVDDAGEPALPNPIESLKKDFSITLEDEDFHKIIFKGFLEKEVVVLPSIRGTSPMKATFKTLTGEEYDIVDVLLAEDIRDTRMTNEGYSTRRSMWILALGVTHIQGKPVCPIEYRETDKGREVDLKATAQGRRSVLSKLNASVLTRFTRIHGQLTLAINAIFEDPEADYLKKP